jgi:3-phosphoshikimate 1-carboxyvinyltransferase
LGSQGTAPIHIEGSGRIMGGRASIPGDISSQFVSSLLIPAPYFDEGLDLKVQGEVKSRPYIDLTVRVMEQFGASVEQGEGRYNVPPGTGYAGRTFEVPGDYSAAAFLFAASAITGSEIRISGLERESVQADQSFLPILEEMGCVIEREGDSVLVRGGELTGMEVDLSDSPDLLPPLSIVMSVARGPSKILGVAHARYKESDRISVMHTELARVGIHSTERPDGLELRGGETPLGREAFSHGDHRVAMALAVLGLVSKGLVVRGASCISISYPDFVRDLQTLGAKLGWR